jgi:hypothetical protein
MWLDCVVEAPLSILGTGYPSLHKNMYNFTITNNPDEHLKRE